MIVCGTNVNSLRERLLRKPELIHPKAISGGHATVETRKHALKILMSNETNNLHKISKHLKSKSQTYAQAKDIIKNASFAIMSSLWKSLP